jgi:hypothetical protein
MAYKQEFSADQKTAWVRWLAGYGAERFLDAFLRNAQYAQGVVFTVADASISTFWKVEGFRTGVPETATMAAAALRNRQALVQADTTHTSLSSEAALLVRSG